MPNKTERFQFSGSEPEKQKTNKREADQPETETDQEREKREFRERWEGIFNEEETKQIVSHPMKCPLALFRVSSAIQELPEIQKPGKFRSWSDSLKTATFYLRHRILNPLEVQVEDPRWMYYNPLFESDKMSKTPVIKIINRKDIEEEFLRKGLEGDSKFEIGEFEIEETKINPEAVIVITHSWQATELKKILLGASQPKSKGYKTMEALLNNLIETLNSINKAKKIIEEREEIEKAQK